MKGDYGYCRVVKGGLIVHLIPKVAHSAIGNHLGKGVVETIKPTDQREGYRFMCVRHPLDRIVSGWSFFTQQAAKYHILHESVELLGYKADMSFKEWLAHCLVHYDENIHTAKQIMFTGGHEIDELCAIENLSTQWIPLQRKYNLDAMEVCNASIHNPWEEYYDDASRAVAEEVFSEDIELYMKALNWEK